MMQIKALVNFNQKKDDKGKTLVKYIPVTINVQNITTPKLAKQIVKDSLEAAGLKEFDIHEHVEVQYQLDI